MIFRTMSLRVFVLHFIAAQASLSLVAAAVAQQPAAEATPSQDAESESQQKQVDPFEVPDGGVDELMEFMQTGPQKMQPRTRDDALRMFQSLAIAAERIFDAEEATVDQRINAAATRMALLSRLQMVGDAAAGDELRKFIQKVANDPAPELQDLAKKTMLDQKIASWHRLPPAEQDAVISEIRAGVTGEKVDGNDVVALMQLADAAAETPAAEKVVALVSEVLPQLREQQDEAIAARIEALEGLVRRLELPGNKMEVEGILLSGEPVDWESFRGKVVLVDYWATWCGPCIAELPNVLAAYEAYHERGFDVLGISLDQDKDAVKSFLEARNVPWQTLFHHDYEEGEEGWDHPMATKYAINGIPRAILVDQDGKVVSMNLRGPALKQALAELLGPIQPQDDQETGAAGVDQAGKTARAQP